MRVDVAAAGRAEQPAVQGGEGGSALLDRGRRARQMVAGDGKVAAFCIDLDAGRAPTARRQKAL